MVDSNTLAWINLEGAHLGLSVNAHQALELMC